MFFDQLDLSDEILDALDAMNFSECTPIQEQAIPPLLEGRDLIGIAQTGTGKTAAYLLPVLDELSSGLYPKDAVNCIIMSPTRELAQQIDQQVQGFAYYLDGVPTWEQVADALHYSVSRIYQLRRSAFEKIYCIDNRTNVRYSIHIKTNTCS